MEREKPENEMILEITAQKNLVVIPSGCSNLSLLGYDTCWTHFLRNLYFLLPANISCFDHKNIVMVLEMPRWHDFLKLVVVLSKFLHMYGYLTPKSEPLYYLMFE